VATHAPERVGFCLPPALVQRTGGLALADRWATRYDSVSNSSAESPFAEFIGAFELPTVERRAPWWPFAGALMAAALSLGLVFVERSVTDRTLLIVALIGYFLTPFATAVFLILAMALHRRMSVVYGYVEASGQRQIKWCSLVAWSGFVIALPHIWQVADYFSLLLAPGA